MKGLGLANSRKNKGLKEMVTFHAAGLLSAVPRRTDAGIGAAQQKGNDWKSEQREKGQNLHRTQNAEAKSKNQEARGSFKAWERWPTKFCCSAVLGSNTTPLCKHTKRL